MSWKIPTITADNQLFWIISNLRLCRISIEWLIWLLVSAVVDTAGLFWNLIFIRDVLIKSAPFFILIRVYINAKFYIKSLVFIRNYNMVDTLLIYKGLEIMYISICIVNCLFVFCFFCRFFSHFFFSCFCFSMYWQFVFDSSEKTSGADVVSAGCDSCFVTIIDSQLRSYASL